MGTTLLSSVLTLQWNFNLLPANLCSQQCQAPSLFEGKTPRIA